MSESANLPEEIGRRTLASGRFVALEEISWRDAAGGRRLWESAERVSGQAAVLLIAWLTPSERLVLIRQHRPPARGEVVEFPAGLVDPGESPAQAATRELLEETGYFGVPARILPPAFSTPGLSSEAVHVALVEIDEALPANLNPQPRPEAGEHIRTLAVERGMLLEFLREETENGTRFDSKVVAYILGLDKAAL